MKREFLVEDKKVEDYLQKNSITCKLYRYKDKNSYMYDFNDFSYVLEEHKSFKKLVLISDNEVILDELIANLQEITDDKRYSKEYLDLFGNPKNYEFDEKKIFEKCDSAGLTRLDLHFKDGMGSAKVFRVVLYRLNQIFTLEYAQYLQKEIEYEVLEESHQRLVKALKYSRKIFDQQIIKQIRTDFEDLYMLLNHQDTFERYVLNFQMFIYEESFYSIKESDKPIYFFKKQKQLFALMKETK
jgi:hypothetical protein